MKAAIWARVSTDEQETDLPLPGSLGNITEPPSPFTLRFINRVDIIAVGFTVVYGER